MKSSTDPRQSKFTRITILITNLLVAGAICVAPVTVRAQSHQPQVRTLAAPEGEFPEPFSQVAGLAELSDGRVAVADRLERLLRMADFETGELIELGRQGRGPTEYLTPAAVFPMRGDSLLLVDMGNLRMAQLDPEGRIVDTHPLLHPSGTLIVPEAADRQGNVYWAMTNVQLPPGGGGSQLSDRVPIAKWDRRSQAFDTVGYLALPERGDAKPTELNLGGGMSFVGSVGPRPFEARDGWAVSPDGRLGIARAQPYRVDWLRDAVEETRGPPVAYDPVPLTSADRRAWAEAQANRQLSIVSTDGGQSRTMKMPKPDLDGIDFPDHKPAFHTSGVWVTPEGDIWVERHLRAEQSKQLFDVFDSRGELIEQVELPRDRRLVGLGRNTAYAVYRDRDDLEWLERYRR